MNVVCIPPRLSTSLPSDGSLEPWTYFVLPLKGPKIKTEYIDSESWLSQPLELYGCSRLFFFIFFYFFVFFGERDPFPVPLPVGSFYLTKIRYWRDEVGLRCLICHRKKWTVTVFSGSSLSRKSRSTPTLLRVVVTATLLRSLLTYPSTWKVGPTVHCSEVIRCITVISGTLVWPEGDVGCICFVRRGRDDPPSSSSPRITSQSRKW